MGNGSRAGVGENRDVHRAANDGSRHSPIGSKPAHKNITSSLDVGIPIRPLTSTSHGGDLISYQRARSGRDSKYGKADPRLPADNARLLSYLHKLQ